MYQIAQFTYWVPKDGFNSICDTGILTCNGKQITIHYHRGTGHPIIKTATGI
jgi:hypothetical protein